MLGRTKTEAGPSPFLFEGRKYAPGKTYRWDDLPSVTRHDAKIQSDDFEAHFGRGYRDLDYHLIVVPHAEVMRVLRERYGDGLERMLRSAEVRRLASLIEKHGLRYPPVHNEGWKRALAIADLGRDLPYFDATLPFGAEPAPFIPTLEGRRGRGPAEGYGTWLVQYADLVGPRPPARFSSQERALEALGRLLQEQAKRLEEQGKIFRDLGQFPYYADRHYPELVGQAATKIREALDADKVEKAYQEWQAILKRYPRLSMWIGDVRIQEGPVSGLGEGS